MSAALRIRDEIRDAVGAVPAGEQWPPVSIVVPTHDGKPLLERLMTGLAGCTNYPSFEVVVVDNASSDGTVEWLERETFPFPVALVVNPRNFSFSAACNRGAEAARGELLLFMNNDVEPIEPGWLRRLVMSLTESEGAIAGAILVDPDRESASGVLGAVQHRDVVVRRVPGGVRPQLRGLGHDVSAAIGPDRVVSAVAAACALVRRRSFERVGGFSHLYLYGGEDVDLCYRLIAAGERIVSSGSSVLLHRPLSTRRGTPAGSREVTLSNHRILLERWGPALRREQALDSAAGAGVWTDSTEPDPSADPTASFRVLGPGAAELAADLRKLGRTADSGSEQLDWLLDDVVLHLGDGRHALLAGRINVILRTGEPRRHDAEIARYDLVLDRSLGTLEIVARVEEALDEAGGLRRIEGSARGSRVAWPDPGAQHLEGGGR